VPFDKGKFISDFTDSGMEEAQAELLAENQADLMGQLPSKADISSMQSGFEAEQAGLRRELDGKITAATDKLRREVNEQIQKTRLLIDDVQVDVRKTEAHLEGVMKTGFATMDRKFNIIAYSNTAAVVSAMVFMAFLFRW
jgi:SMC interacting uncharacterized protein involved in chromosome segregation